MTTTDPTPLVEQIAREHQAVLDSEFPTLGIALCTCGEVVPPHPGDWYTAHIATVTEQAARERDAEALARFTQDDGVARLVVTDLRDLRPGDFIMHPTVDGLAVARGWQYKFEADHEHAVRARVAAELRFSDAEWREYQNLPELGYPHRAWLDSRAARIAKGDHDA
jgi:hypothetical protein